MKPLMAHPLLAQLGWVRAALDKRCPLQAGELAQTAGVFEEDAVFLGEVSLLLSLPCEF